MVYETINEERVTAMTAAPMTRMVTKKGKKITVVMLMTVVTPVIEYAGKGMRLVS